MKATAELKMLPVSVLKPAAYNPRKKLKPGDKEYEKIKNSITEFGFADPLVVNADMTIIGGHQRLTVAMELGYTEVPCAVVDIDKTREKALNIALNKITGAWDDSLLADLLKDIEDSNFDLGKTGFEPPEIETLFNKVHSKEVKEDDFDVESELKQPCFSKEGDLWHLGKHIVLCGDSTKAECYDTLMDGTKANLVLSDPPYNVDVEETAGKILNDNMGDSEFYQFLLAAFQQMHGHLADDGSIYIFHADTEGLNFRKAFKDAGFYLSGCCIWKKNALVLGRSPYQWQHEPCLYGWKQKGKHQWYFMSLLAGNAGWTSAGIYSDHGISATSRDGRTGFNRLLRHCKQGKIDRVICKSISRFARNTQDFLVALRTLKENNVTILFEREAMDTADAYIGALAVLMWWRPPGVSCRWSEIQRIQMSASSGR